MAGKGPKSKTGGRCTIERTSHMILPWVVVRDVKESDLPSDVRDPELSEKEFLPSGKFPADEQKWALAAISAAPTAAPNLRRVFYVRFAKSSGGSPDSRVVHEVRNATTCKWEISSFGAPASRLPEGAAATAIETRLASQKISKGSGTWAGKEWPCVLAALDTLTDTEMQKIAGVTIRRAGSGPDPEAGGNYFQEQHAIQLYDKGMKNGDALALGAAPPKMLPGPGHAVLHEVGHAVAHAPLRAGLSKLAAAKEKVKSKGSGLQATFGTAAFSFDEAAWAYRYSEAEVREESREQFMKEVKGFETSFKEAAALDKATPSASGVVKRFRDLVKTKKMPPVTPYSKQKLEEAGGLADLEAVEEFFAESFAIWKWYPDWLQEHRKPIHGFFSAGKHLG